MASLALGEVSFTSRSIEITLRPLEAIIVNNVPLVKTGLEWFGPVWYTSGTARKAVAEIST